MCKIWRITMYRYRAMSTIIETYYLNEQYSMQTEA